jgi:hypothetical protein
MSCGCGSPINNAVAAFYTENSWNIPLSGAQAILNVPTLADVVVGSLIWNPTYGYFRVISFNSILNQIVIINDNTSGNAAPGTVVPAYTNFTTTTPLEVGAVQDFSSTISYGGLGNMTYTVNPADIHAQYILLGRNLVWYTVLLTGTTGGTPSYGLWHSLPFPPLAGAYNNGSLNAQISGLPSSTLQVPGMPGIDTPTSRVNVSNYTYTPLQIGPNISLNTGGLYLRA